MQTIGLSIGEMQQEIERRMERMDEAQDEDGQLGQYGDLLRTAAVIAFQRAAELIDDNNRRVEQQLRDAGVLKAEA